MAVNNDFDAEDRLDGTRASVLPQTVLDRSTRQSNFPSLQRLSVTLENLAVLQADENTYAIDVEGLSAKPKADIGQVLKDLSAVGLYPKKANYHDGQVGGLTRHGLALAADPNFALTHIREQLQRTEQLSEADFMKLNADLNRAGYDAGEVAGKPGPKFSQAIREFVKENPDIGKVANKQLGDIISASRLSDSFDLASKGKQIVPTFSYTGEVKLRPELIEEINNNPKVAGYFAKTIAVAAAHHVDPVILANKIYTESSYDPGKVSKTGARGLGQFMKTTGAEYDLHSPRDFHDPDKSLEASAKYLEELTKKYGPRLAVAVYNGGGDEKGGVVEYVQRRLGTKEMPSIDQVMAVLQEQRKEYGIDKNPKLEKSNLYAHKWCVETYNHVERVLEGAKAKIEPIPMEMEYDPARKLTRATQSEIQIIHTANDDEKRSPLAKQFDGATSPDLLKIADLAAEPASTKKGPDFRPNPFA